MTTGTLLDVQGLSVRFAMPRRSLFGQRPVLHAVRDVSFSLRPGRTLGLVGESGSGKTTAAMAAIRLAAGWHPIRVYYRHATGPRSLAVEVTPPAGARQKVAGALIAAGK